MQEVIVGVIVAFCVVFSAWRLMSPRLRLRTLEALTPVLSKVGAKSHLDRLRAQVMGQLGGGCSACSHNKSTVHHPGARRG